MEDLVSIRHYLLRLACLFVTLSSLSALVQARALENKVISEITVEGNVLTSGQDILSWLKVKPGDVYSDVNMVVDRDLKALWDTGKFEDVQASLVPLSNGQVRLVITVKEKPIINSIQFSGNKSISSKDLLDKLDIKPGTPYDEFQAEQLAEKTADFYREKEFYQVVVTPVVQKLDNDKVNLTFDVDEGMKVKVTKITVSGNKAFSEGKIKGFMETKEAGWFVGGTFKEETFITDLKKILYSYAREGYLKAKIFGMGLMDIDGHKEELVKEAVHVDTAKKEMNIHLDVEEGIQYKIAAINIKGNIIFSEDELLGRMDLKKGEILDRLAFEQDMQKIRSAYSEKGYIFADVSPELDYNDEAGLVTITIIIREGTIARVEHILIRGNTITKDKVIRREINIEDGEPFDSRKIQRAQEDIMNLGFFQDVRISTEPGSTPSEQVLVFEVEERQTGTISLGAGYSSVDQLMGYLQLTQANLFGNGQSVSLQWELGSLRQSWQMSFTEPWLFDAPVSFGVDVWNINKENGYNGQGYNLLSQGGDIRFGRRFSDVWKGYLTYKLESNEYTDITTSDLLAVEGRTDTSSLTPTLVYDSRDNIFDPNYGMYHRLSVEFAGGVLGGDNNFLKYGFDTSYYIPLIWKLVLALHGEFGYVNGFDYGVRSNPDLPDVPVSELYRVGGTDSVRGYSDGSLQGDPKRNGGQLKLVTNVELHYPIIGPLKGVAFFDAGNVWSNFRNSEGNDFVEDPSLRKGVGTGVRLTIPGTVILIRFDFGYPLDPLPGTSPGLVYHFSIGNIF